MVDEVCPAAAAANAAVFRMLTVASHVVMSLPPFDCSLIRLNACLYINFTTFLCLGYGRQFRGLKDFLSKQSFADQIEVLGHEDRGVTGNFEVTVKETGQLLHSKRTAGQGKAESKSERAALVEMIAELLDE